jgi:hypothetical protein
VRIRTLFQDDSIVSNTLLDDLDKELERRQLKFVR